MFEGLRLRTKWKNWYVKYIEIKTLSFTLAGDTFGSVVATFQTPTHSVCFDEQLTKSEEEILRDLMEQVCARGLARVVAHAEETTG